MSRARGEPYLAHTAVTVDGGTRMQIGVNLGHETQRDGHGMRRLARAVEAGGYDALWTSEHLAIPAEFSSTYPYTAGGRPQFDPTTSFASAMVTLAHVAAVTERVRLGTGVIPMFAHNPVALAKDAASVDRLSGGRLELGVGAGWLVEEAHLLGNPTDHRWARLGEAVNIMQKAWAQAPFEHHGHFWDIPPTYVRPAPAQSAGIPIWIGGTGKQTLQTLAAVGARGAFLASAEATKVADVRARLGAEKQIGLFVNIAGDFDRRETQERIAALRAAGATLVILSINRYRDDADSGVQVVERFAEELLDVCRAS